MRQLCILLGLGLLCACSSSSAAKGTKAAADVGADVESIDLVLLGTDAEGEDLEPDVAVEEVFEPADIELDATMPDPVDGCAPQCEGKICGPDNCGSICGFCISGQQCTPDGTQCKTLCLPDCTKKGKQCGDNGCGGKCGTCDGGYHCGIDFLCYKDDCNGSCAGKVCGDDGCGKSCGVCASGDVCTTGECKPGPCKGIPKTGSCTGKVLTLCIGEAPDQTKQVTDCAAKLPAGSFVCDYDPGLGTNACVPKPKCVPKCLNGDGTKKLCGPDECGDGGVCGVCPNGWACPGGTCVPQVGADCGSFSAVGKCVGDTWMWCNTGKIAALNCADAQMTCGWDGKKFGCQ